MHHGVSKKFGKVTVTKGNLHEDEPIFILRASDTAAIRAIARYRNDIESADGLAPTYVAGIDEVIADFSQWAVANPDLVKLPS